MGTLLSMGYSCMDDLGSNSLVQGMAPGLVGTVCDKCAGTCVKRSQTCGGGSAAARAAHAGACESPDKMKFDNDGKDAGMSKLSQTCGMGCGVQALQGYECVSKCAAADGYSAGCADCVGKQASCILAHCLNECLADSGSSACSDCAAKFCAAEFQTCSGLGVPEPASVQCSAADVQMYEAKGKEAGSTALQSSCGNLCGIKILSGNDCVVGCAKEAGYSANCSMCFAQQASCVVNKCLGDCATAEASNKCSQCVTSNCMQAFIGCSGFGKQNASVVQGKTSKTDTEKKFYPIGGEGDISFVHSIATAWNNPGTKMLAVMIGLFSGAWPYLKCVLMMLAWFLPMRTSARRRLLAGVTWFGRWSLLDVYAVITIIIALQFDIMGGGVTVRAMPQPAISTFAIAAVFSLCLSEWLKWRDLAVTTPDPKEVVHATEGTNDQNGRIDGHDHDEKTCWQKFIHFCTLPVVVLVVGLIALGCTIASVVGPWCAFTIADPTNLASAGAPSFFTLGTLLNTKTIDRVPAVNSFVVVFSVIVGVVFPLFGTAGVCVLAIAKWIQGDSGGKYCQSMDLRVPLLLETTLVAFCCLDVLLLGSYIIVQQYKALMTATVGAVSPCVVFVFEAYEGWAMVTMFVGSLLFWWVGAAVSSWQPDRADGRKKYDVVELGNGHQADLRSF